MTHCIDGEWFVGTGSLRQSSGPWQSRTLWEGREPDAELIAMAMRSARSAQQEWAALEREARIEVLRSFARVLERESEAMSQCISEETGKPLWESRTEVSAAIAKIDISIQAEQERCRQFSEGNLGLTHRPHGTMVVLGPYNFPLHLPNGHIVPALLAGNAVVFKPSEKTPATAHLTMQLWLQAGLPKGVLNLIQGGRETAQCLLDASPDGVLFTGSSLAGKAIHRHFAGRPECVLALEMGGNNALIVGSEFEPEVQLWHIIRSAFISAGQRCTCARRLIVVDTPEARALIARLLETVPKLSVGHWQQQPQPFMGPLIDQAAAQTVLTQQQKLHALGATMLTPCRVSSENAALLSPGIVDITSLSGEFDEEVFGPLLQLQWVPNIEEAVARANASDFGLAAGLLSDKESEQRYFSQHIRAGVIAINAATAGASSRLPFGGIGASGNHRPSAYYAADYSAWPQARSQGPLSSEQQPIIPEGVKV